MSALTLSTPHEMMISAIAKAAAIPLPASPKPNHAKELEMLNRLYNSVEDYLRGVDMDNEDDAEDMRILKNAAEEFLEAHDTYITEQREVALERRGPLTEQEEDDYKEVVEEFISALWGIPDRKAFDFFEKHSDFVGIVVNIAQTINDFEPEEEESDEE